MYICAPTQRCWFWKDKKKHILLDITRLSSTVSPLVRAELCHYTWSQKATKRVRSIFYSVIFFLLSFYYYTFAQPYPKFPIQKGSIHKIADTLHKTSTFSNSNYSYLPLSTYFFGWTKFSRNPTVNTVLVYITIKINMKQASETFVMIT